MLVEAIVYLIVLFCIAFKESNMLSSLDGMTLKLFQLKSMNFMKKYRMEILIGLFQISLWPLWVL